MSGFENNNIVNVTYVVSNINKALAFEWVAEYLDQQKIRLTFILLNPGDTEFEQWLINKKIPVFRVLYRGKRDIVGSFVRVKNILKATKTNVVHTHLFDANIIGLAAAWVLGIPKRILTRHHSTLHHKYFPRAVYYDKFTNSMATHIIAISELVKKILIEMENVEAHKVFLVHHGFDIDKFKFYNQKSVDHLREKYGVINNYPVIGVIARQTEWKGIQYIIPAFAMLQKKYPDAKLILANATGDFKCKISDLLSKYLPKHSYLEILFESDLSSLYQLFDFYVHVPIDNHSEAFGQTYVEALAAGVPSIFTLSGVASEFIVDHRNAIVVPFENSDSIFSALELLINNNDLVNLLVSKGYDDVSHFFSIKNYINKLENLYLS